jgi:hypothetical protein
VAGLVVGPALTTLLFMTPILVAFVEPSRFDLAQAGVGAAVLGWVYAQVLLFTLIVGLPTWLALRIRGRESGLAYALAGSLGGFVIGAFRGHIGGGAGLYPLMILAVYVLAGAVTALTFWLIARERASV